MEIDFFNILKYRDIFDNYDYATDIPKLISENKNIYYYDSTSYAFIYIDEKYIMYANDTDYIESLTPVELAFNVGKYYEESSLFTNKR